MDKTMKYEDQVRKICGENWRTVEEDEKQGGYGVACLIAFMKGSKPSLPEIAKHLGVTPDEISMPFVRLQRNGAFAREGWNAKEDHELLKLFDNRNDREKDEAEAMWAFVAAVSSGFLGVYC